MLSDTESFSLDKMRKKLNVIMPASIQHDKAWTIKPCQWFIKGESYNVMRMERLDMLSNPILTSQKINYLPLLTNI